MNLLDVIILVLLLAAAIGGYRMGFVTRVLSWIGLLIGLVLAVRAVPWLVGHLGEADRMVVLAVAIGTIFAGTFLGQAIGLAVGSRLRPVDRHDGGVTHFDGVAGAVAGMVGLLAVFWLVMPVLASTTGWVSAEAAGSSIARALDSSLPDPPDTVQTLRAFVGEGGFPEVFEGLRQTPDLGPPPAETGIDPATAETVAASVVLVKGEGCQRIQNGTGFVVAEDLVVTNAHVVAGQHDLEVRRNDGSVLDAETAAFDPRRDLAVLSVPGLGRQPLEIASASEGDAGGVFGHPGGEPLRIAPARVANTITAVGRDIYGAGGAERQVLELASELRPGDSGAPLINPAGQVAGVVFAVATDRNDVAYALTTGELRAVLDGEITPGVSPGGCVT